MTRIRKLLTITLLAVCVMVFTCITVNATDITYTPKGAAYDLLFTENEDGTLTVIGHSRHSSDAIDLGDLIIPAEVEGKTVTAISTGAFSGCTSFTGKLELPETLITIKDDAFNGCSGLTGNLTLPEGLTCIGGYCFVNCSGFSGDLIIPENIKYIYAHAFSGCSGFNGTLQLPESLLFIDSNAFAGCTGLTGNLIIPPGVYSVSNYAFSGCTGFNGKLVIPYSIERLTERPFSSCSNIKSIYIPTECPYEIWTFNNCSGVTDIYYGGTESDWETLFSSGAAQGFPPNATVHYESYPAKDLELQGTNHYVNVGDQVTITAKYFNSEPVADPSFIWSSTDPAVLVLEETACELSAGGYSATLSATFTGKSEGNVSVSVAAPGDLSVSCNVTVVDFKEITYQPSAGQEPNKPIVLNTGDSTFVSFLYETSALAEDEADSLQWSVSVSEDAPEGTDIGMITLSDYSVKITGLHTAIVSAKVTANEFGGPVDIIVTGPASSQDSCSVLVPDERIFFLTDTLTVPSEGEVLRRYQSAGESFDVYLRYETNADFETALENAKNFTWHLTTEDFMVDPANMEEGSIPVPKGALTAIPLETITCTKQEEGVYLVKAVFMPALDGVSALKVETDRYANDVCLVFSSFDITNYRAATYHDPNNKSAQGAKSYFDCITPSVVILDKLQEDSHLDTTAAIWTAYKATLDTIDNPANIYEYAVSDYELYCALLLNLLQRSTEDAVQSNMQAFTEYGSDLCNYLTAAFQATYQIDLSVATGFTEVIEDAEKAQLLQGMVQESFQAKYKGLDYASLAISGLDVVATGYDTYKDYQNAVSTAAIVAEIGESMEIVVETMLAECPEDNIALKTALEYCLTLIHSNTEDVHKQVLSGTLLTGGITAAQKSFGLIWDGIMSDIKLACPQVAIIRNILKGSGTMSNILFNTDATLEAYYRMSAFGDIKALARDAHDALSAAYQASPSTKTASAYLTAVDMMFYTLMQDCDLAYNYVAVIDTSLASYVLEALNGSSYDNALNIITSFRRDFETAHAQSQVFWIYSSAGDYPGTLLDHQYEDVYNAVVGYFPKRMINIACPVDVAVLDAEGNTAAYVTGRTVSCEAEDISILLNGNEKIITFYSDAVYSLELKGTDTGKMNITDVLYNADGEEERCVRYYDLSLADEIEYTIPAYSKVQSENGMTVTPDSDTDDDARYTIQILSGAMDFPGETMLTAQAAAGQLIPITAYIPEGYTFLGWTSDCEETVFTDKDSPVTSMRMPCCDVTVTAMLYCPDELISDGQLLLTGANGEVLHQIPQDKFTVRISAQADASFYLLAGYTSDGRMIQVFTPETTILPDGTTLLTFTADNHNGKISQLTVFYLESLSTLRPVCDPVIYSAASQK